MTHTPSRPTPTSTPTHSCVCIWHIAVQSHQHALAQLSKQINEVGYPHKYRFHAHVSTHSAPFRHPTRLSDSSVCGSCLVRRLSCCSVPYRWSAV